MAITRSQHGLRLWLRVAAWVLVVGGAGYLAKYLLLAVFDPTPAATGQDPVTMVVLTRTGLLLGTVLVPLGCTAVVPALLLRGRHVLLAVAGGFAAVIAVLLLTHVLDAAFGFLHGDPLRLQTEGSLAIVGLLAVVSGILLLRRPAQ